MIKHMTLRFIRKSKRCNILQLSWKPVLSRAHQKKSLPIIRLGVPSKETVAEKTVLFKIFNKNQYSGSLFDTIPKSDCYYQTRNCKIISQFRISHIFFKNSFQSAITEWNKLDQNFRISDNISIFERKLLIFARLFRLVLLIVIIPRE